MKRTIVFLILLSILLPAAILHAEDAESRIGIIGAMEEEVALLKENMDIDEVITVTGMDFYLGSISGKPAVVVQCGVGKVNAGICTQTLINEFDVSKVINTGVAGSLDNAIDIEDIVVSTDCVQYDYDVSPLGYEKGEILYTGLYAFPADDKLQDLALKAIEEAVPDVSSFSGRICTGDQFIYLTEQKDAIVESFGGYCCDMESGAIAQVCYLNEIPYVILRSISDKPDGSEEMEYNLFKDQAAERNEKVVLKMLEEM